MAGRRPNPAQSELQGLAPPSLPAVDAPVHYLVLAAVANGIGWGVWRLVGGGAAALAAGLAVAIATIVVWLGLMTPGDPARSRFGRLAIPGPARLAGELLLLSLAAAAIWKAGSRSAAETLLTVAGLRYSLSWGRVVWLLGRGAGAARRSAHDANGARSGG